MVVNPFPGRYFRQLLFLLSLGWFFTAPVFAQTAGLTVTPTMLTVNEGGTNTYTIMLNTAPTRSVAVRVDSNDEGAAVEDVSTSGILHFLPENWNSPQTVTVNGVEDSDTNNETVTLTHIWNSQDPEYSTGHLQPNNPVTVTVTDNDVVLSSTSTLTVVEGATNSYTLALASAPSSGVTITVMSENMAVATVSPAQLTFTTGDWNTPKTVTVTGVQDVDARAGSVNLRHTVSSADGNYNDAPVDSVSVSVTDDETAGVTVNVSTLTVTEGGTGTYTLVLSSKPVANLIAVEISSGDTGSVTVDPARPLFTDSNWNKPQTVTVSGVKSTRGNAVTLSHATSSVDADYNGATSTTVMVNVAPPGVTVSEATLMVNEGETVTYMLMLDTQPAADVMITVASGDMDAASVSPTTLTFTTADWNTGKTFTVTGEEDDDANNEVNVQLTHTASSTDAAYNGNAVTIAGVTVNVDDNDTAGVAVTPTMLNVNEGATGTYTLMLTSQPRNDVVITVASGDADAASVNPGTLTFTDANWNVARMVTVTGEEDDDANNEVSVRLTHTAESSDAAYNGNTVTIAEVAVNVDDNDMAGVTVSEATLMVNEGGIGTYTLMLTSQPRNNVTVAVGSGDMGAASVSPTTLTFTTADWNTGKTFTVTGEEDDDANNEVNVQLTHTASSTDAAYNGNAVAIASVAVTVDDNETAGVTVSETELTFNEGTNNNTYTLVLDTLPTAAMTITVESNDAEAASVSPMMLTFDMDDWNTAKTFTVTGEQDADANNETVSLTHTFSGGGPAYAADAVPAVSINAVTVTVNDDETAGVTVSETSLTFNEGTNNNTYSLVLDTQPTVAMTITVMTDDAEAASVSPSTLTFDMGDWNTAKTVTVMGEQDADANNETVSLTHTFSGGGPAYASVTIDAVTVNVDDDEEADVTVVGQFPLAVGEGATATYTLELTSPPTVDVTVAVSSTTAATVSSTPALPLIFTSANWNTARTVTVMGAEDADADDAVATLMHTLTGGGPAYASVTIADITVNVTDNEMARVTVSESVLRFNEGATETYTLELTSPPTAAMTISVMTDDENAASVSPATLTFTMDDWNTAKMFTVTGEEDADANTESVTLTHTFSGGGPAYAGPPAVTIDAVTVTVNDDDRAGVTLNASTLEVSEGGSGGYTLMLDTRPMTDVTIMVVATGDTGAATVSPTSLTFTNVDWNTAKTVTVMGVEDSNATDGNVSLAHTVDNSSDVLYRPLMLTTVAVTVRDNDTPGVSVSPTRLEVAEGANVEYMLMLNTQPAHAVMITVGSGDMGAVSVSPTTLTFSTSDWNTGKTFTVTGEQDADADNEVDVQLTHTASSTDNTYNGNAVAIADVSVTVDDNETAGVTVSETELMFNEGTNNNTYSLVLDTRPTVAMTITVMSDDAEAASVSPSTLSFTMDDWDTPKTFTVTGVEDADANNETVSLTHTFSGGGPAYADATPAVMIAPVTVNVDDDETADVTVMGQFPLAVGEGATATYTLELTSPPTAAVTVAVSSTTAATVSSTPALPLIFTSANWDTARTVTVMGAEDADADDAVATLTHTLTGGGPAYASVTIADITVNVNDDEEADVTVVGQFPLAVGEGATATYTLELTSPPTAAVTVAVSSTTAATVSSTPALPLIFTSANWDTARTVTVMGAEDADADDAVATLTHTLTGGGPAYASVTIADITVNVDDDEEADVTVVGQFPLAVGEGATATYTLVLTTPPTAAMTISVMTDDEDAASVSPATLTFTMDDWNTAKMFTVTGEQDADANTESVTLTHTFSGGGPAYAGPPAVTIDAVTVTVNDDETAGVIVTPTMLDVAEGAIITYTLVLTSAPTTADDVSIMVGSGDMGAVSVNPRTLTFTDADWNMAKTVTVMGVEDADANDESGVTLTQTLSGGGVAYTGVRIDEVTVNVDDNDTAGVTVTPTMLNVNEGATVTYMLALTSLPTNNVSITVGSGDAGAASVNPRTLTFTDANWNVARTVMVTGEEDDDANNEVSVRLTHTAESTDAAYNGNTVTIAEVTVNVDDNDTAGVAVSQTALTLGEGETGNYTLMLTSQPREDVRITLDNDGTGAVSVSPALLTFTNVNWNSAQTLTVMAVEDDDANNERVNLTHTAASADAAYNGGAVTIDAVAVTVTDNETAGVTVSRTTLEVSEGGVGDYRLVLNARPALAVTITVESDDMGAATVTPATLTFDTTDWNTAKTVTVSGVEDADMNNESVRLNHTVSSSDTLYNTVTPLPVAVTVRDNETMGVTVSSTTLAVSEGGTGGYTLALNTAPASAVTITVASGDPGAVTATASLTFTASDWNRPKRVTVTGVEDNDANNENNVQLTHTVSSTDTNYNTVMPLPVAVTVRDNDMAGVTVSPTDLVVSEGGTGGYRLVLTSRPTLAVTIMVESNDMGAATVSPGSLTFTDADWNTAKRVTVTGVEDADTDSERVRLNHTVSSSDTLYSTVMPAAVAVAVNDNEAVGVSVSSTTLDVNEGSTIHYTLVLNTRPSDHVTIAVATGDAEAVTATTSLTFTDADWNTAKRVTVTGVDDDDANNENNVQLTHTVSSGDTNYNAFTPPAVAVTVNDDEMVGVTVSQTALTLGERETGNYTLMLTSQPTDDVAIAVESDDTGAATVSPALLTFTNVNWNSAQMMTVTGIEDVDLDNESVRLTHTVSSSDTGYAAVTPDAVLVTVTELAISLDVDNSGGAPNQGDGLMIGRYLFGIRDMVGLLDTIPGSPSFSVVTANIARAVASGRLDVDGSGGAANQGDGLMIGRYLFGIRDTVGLLDTIPGNPSFNDVRTNIEALLQ